MRFAFTVLTAASCIAFLVLSYSAGHHWQASTGPKFHGFGVDLLAVSSLLAIAAFRSFRQSVIVSDGMVVVRGIFRSKTIATERIIDWGLFKNLIRNSWLGGVKLDDGTIVKFPFYAKSWIRSDPRNDRMKDFVSKIREAAESNVGSTSSLVDTIFY